MINDSQDVHTEHIHIQRKVSTSFSTVNNFDDEKRFFYVIDSIMCINLYIRGVFLTGSTLCICVINDFALKLSIIGENKFSTDRFYISKW